MKLEKVPTQRLRQLLTETERLVGRRAWSVGVLQRELTRREEQARRKRRCKAVTA